ncbi:hypothetical protein MBLNU459_g0717t1 [Dothideomycetes sp. NU459]
MPLVQSSQDYLPYIDTPASASELDSARALVAAELASDHKTAPHPSLPALPSPAFSDLVTAEHARLAAGAPKPPGIDLSRYEAQDAPGPGAPLPDWRAALQQAYASSEYLSSRLTNLGLLETYGKNAWLVSNDQLEGVLKDAEREVAALKSEAEELERQRKGRQDGASGELLALEQSWRVGVGRMLEVEVAAEALRRQILERQRSGAK